MRIKVIFLTVALIFDLTTSVEKKTFNKKSNKKLHKKHHEKMPSLPIKGQVSPAN
jgi:hypothetical protein